MNLSEPFDWPTLPLGSLLTDIQPGFASGKHNSTGNGVPHFRPMNVSPEGRIDRDVLKYIDPSTAGRPHLRLRRGDILFNNTNSPELVGKTALFDDGDEPAFSNHMTRLRTDSRLDPRYLALRLHFAWRQGYFADHCNNHVSQASVSRDVLRSFPIELPPVEVQRAIASLSGSVENRRISSRMHLAVAQRAIERFRQAVLAAACSGRLTVDWRQVHLESGNAKALLDDIDSLRKSHYRPPAPEWEFEIADSWALISFDRLTTFITSGSRGWGKYYAPDGPLFIRAQNINSDWLDLADIAHVRPPRGSEGERTMVHKDDLLVTITGANVTRSAFVDRDIGEAYVNQHVALCRPVLPTLAEYLHLWVVSPEHGHKKLAADAYGAGKPGLNLENLRTTPVGLPPLEEQAEIVTRVKVLFALAKRVEEKVVGAAHLVDSSSRVVLAKAFRGELGLKRFASSGDVDCATRPCAVQREVLIGRRVVDG